MVAVHQHFGLHDRDDLRRLAQRRVARERMRVGQDRGVARDAGADIDHGAPFREAGALLEIFWQPVGELVEPDGDQFAGAIGKRLGAFVDLDAGYRAGLFDQLDHRCAVFGFLPNRFVVKDHARDVVLHRIGRAEQHLAIIAAIVFRALDADRVEALFDRPRRFVRREDSATRRHHGVGDFIQLCEVHAPSLISSVAQPGLWSISITFPNRVGGGCHFILNTSTPGRLLPSSHSRNAPPAVET